MRRVLPICILALACSLTALADQPIQNPPTPPTPNLRPWHPVTLTGTLLQLRVAVNGDYSGWILLKPQRSFNLGVAGIAHRARAFEGRRVVIRGLLTQGSYADGSLFQEVLVTSIDPAP